MFRSLCSNQLKNIALFNFATAVLLLTPSISAAQRSKGGLDSPDDKQPAFTQFRGVTIGMAVDEARKRMGTPKDKSDERDDYLFNDNEAVTVVYKNGTVSAISVDYLGGNNGVPTPKDIFGAEAETKADGSIFKMVRYPKAGYWVSYSRTAGSEPTITIMIQKIH